MRSKELEARKKSLKLSAKQRSILIGTMLGDGHLETQNHGRTYRLKIEHSVNQRFYVDWLYTQFREWVNTSPKIKKKVLSGVAVTNVHFQTLSVGQFRFYAQQFYENKRKVVPKQIVKWLDPLALAVWFMDDGSLKSKHHKALVLNTQGFSKIDINRLIEALKTRYGIEAAVRRQKDGLQILLSSENADTFSQIIRPNLLTQFEYKLGKLK